MKSSNPNRSPKHRKIRVLPGLADLGIFVWQPFLIVKSRVYPLLGGFKSCYSVPTTIAPAGTNRGSGKPSSFTNPYPSRPIGHPSIPSAAA